MHAPRYPWQFFVWIRDLSIQVFRKEYRHLHHNLLKLTPWQHYFGVCIDIFAFDNVLGINLWQPRIDK